MKSTAELFMEEVDDQKQENFREVTLKVLEKLLSKTETKERSLTMGYFLVFCGMLAFMNLSRLPIGSMVHEFANASYFILLNIYDDDVYDTGSGTKAERA